jgi:CheY-like chemotaxis protein
MKTRAVSCFAMTHLEHERARFLQRLSSSQLSPVYTGVTMPAAELALLPGLSSVARRDSPRPPVIYVVDDLPRLTELYATLLSETAYEVKTFNDRRTALAVLRQDRAPALLITDYLGSTMPICRFIQQSRGVHPRLRILMASGLDPAQMQFSSGRPDRFLQKPFTAHEFQQAITAVLA